MSVRAGAVGTVEEGVRGGRSAAAPGSRSQGERAGAEGVLLAWLSITLIGALAILAMLVLAEPIADAIGPQPLDFFADPLVVGNLVQPEHAELVRVAIGIAAAVAVAAVVAYAPARLISARVAKPARVLAVIGPVAVAALVVVSWVTRSEPSAEGVREPDYFSWGAGAVALALAGVWVWLAVRRTATRPAWLSRAAAVARRRWAAGGVAMVATFCFLLPSAFTDASLPDAIRFILYGHLTGIFADHAAVGNGLTPGVDFAAQYSSLLPYALGPVFSITDYSLGSFTIVATLLSGAALLGTWRALALVTRDELAGVALYVPVLAVSVVPLAIEGDERLSNASQYQLLPERYLLPFALAWLLARHVCGRSPRRTAPLLLLAAVAAFNNPEFGLPCFAAVIGALAMSAPGGRLRPRALASLVLRAGLALLAVGLAICVIDLIRAGSLPKADLILYYSRLFGSQGFGMIPMPELGFHLSVFATFAGAVIVAAVRARRAEPDRPLTAMLGFAGLFGLLACVYYGGRSNAYSLIGLFPVWGFTLALLTWLVIGRLRADPSGGPAAARRAGVLGFLALFGFGLATTTVIQVAAPWGQVSRIADRATARLLFRPEPVESFVAARTGRDEPIAIIGTDGYRIARAAGVRDVSPVADPIHIVSSDQVQDVLDALDAEGGRSVFVRDKSYPPPLPSINDYLRSVDFEPVARDAASGTTEWRTAGR